MENKSVHNDDWLSKLPKESGFDIPKGYFDEVEDQFSIKLREASLPEDAGFDVPNGYFEELEDRVLDHIELPKQGKVISLRTQMLRISSIAAVFVLLFAGYLLFFNGSDEELTYDEIAIWVDDNISDIETEDIISLYDIDEDLDDTFFDNSIESNNIEQYLDENDTYILIEESQGLFDEIN